MFLPPVSFKVGLAKLWFNLRIIQSSVDQCTGSTGIVQIRAWWPRVAHCILLFVLVNVFIAAAYAMPAATVTTITSSPASSVVGAAVQLTVTVTAGGAPVSAGQVAICNNATYACSPFEAFAVLQLSSSGTASTYFYGSGSQYFQAAFAGTRSYAPSRSASAGLTVVFANDTVATSTSIAVGGIPGAYALTATVTKHSLPTVNTGYTNPNVNFYDTSNGNYLLGSVALSSQPQGDLLVAGAVPVAGYQPMYMTTGDFNGDGRADLAVVNTGDKTVSILLANGDGTFQPQVTYATGNAPGAIVTGDFDADGKLDLAIVNNADKTISVLRGTGTGTFLPQVTYATGNNPIALATGDINQDGLPDLVVLNHDDMTIGVLMNHGDGTFAAQATYATGNDPRGISIGDSRLTGVPADGIPDVAIANFADNTITILDGAGDGTLLAPTTQTTISTGNGPIAVSLADIADGGYASLTWLNYTDSTMSVIASQFDGSISGQANYNTGPNPVAFALGYFDQIAAPEPAVLNSDGSVNIFPSSGNYDGSYGLTPTTYSTTQAGASSLAIADFNGDGNTDFVAGGTASLMPALYLQQPHYDTQYVLTGVSVPGVTTSSVVASYPGDGTDPLDGTKQVLQASTSAPVTLTDTPIATATTLTITPSQNVTPGQTVFLTASMSPTSLGNYIPTGAFTFMDGTTPICSGVAMSGFSASCTTGALPISHNVFTAIYLGDTYFASSTSLTKVVNVSNATATALTLSASTVNQGAGVLATATVTDTASASVVSSGGVVKFCEVTSPATACTGTKLLATAQLQTMHGTSPGTVRVNLHLPSGTHTLQAIFVGTAAESPSTSGSQALTVTPPATTISTSSLASSGSAGNYTITATVTGTQPSPSPTGTVSFTDTKNSGFAVKTGTLSGSTAGYTFDAAKTYSPDSNGVVKGIQVVDVNGDGIPDLLYANYGDGSLGVRLGVGDGTFGAQTEYFLGGGVNGYSSPIEVVVADLNGDGKPDVIVADDAYDFTASAAVGYVYVFINNGNSTQPFPLTPQIVDIGDQHAPPTVDSYPGPGTVAVGDFNQDGIPDLAVGTDEGTIYTLMGNGDGTFQAPVMYPAVNRLHNSGLLGLTAVDLNGDGILDLAYTQDYDGSATVMLGNGDGTFQPLIASYANNIGGSGFVGGFTIADFNGDGIPDAAMTFSNLCIMPGNGDGTFQGGNCDNNSGLEQITVGEFTGDGKLDIVSALDSGGIGILPGNGDGTFGSIKKFSAGSNDVAIATADFNGDGVADVATESYYSSKLEMLLGRRTFAATSRFTGVSIPGSASTNQHSLVATYPGDTQHTSSVSSGLTVTGTPITTTTTLSANPSSGVPYGTSVSIVATVSPALSSSYTIAGTVTFKDGTTTLTPTGAFGTGAAAGTSTYAPAGGSFTPALGSHSFTAVYGVDSVANFKTSTSSALAFTVVKATPTIAWSPPGIINGGNTLGSVLTAMVSVPGTLSYTATLSGGSPVAVTTATVLSAGSYTITASFVPTDTTDYNTPTAVNKTLMVVTGNVWILNGDSSLSEMSLAGAPAAGSAILTGSGTAGSGGVAFDSVGNIWSVNSASSQLLQATKTGASPAYFSGGGLNAPAGLAIDGNGAVWIANNSGSVSAFTNAGVPMSPAATGFTGGGMSAATGIAVDISGNVWVSNSGNDSVTEIIGGAAPVSPPAIATQNATQGVKP